MMRNRISLALVLMVVVVLLPMEAISTTMIDLLAQVRVVGPVFSSLIAVDSTGSLVVAELGTGLVLDESVSPPVLNATGGGGGSVSPRTVYYTANGSQVDFGLPSLPIPDGMLVFRNGLLQKWYDGTEGDYRYTIGIPSIQFLSPPGNGDLVTIWYLE